MYTVLKQYVHLCNRHLNQDIKHFHHLREFPYAPFLASFPKKTALWLLLP